MLLTKRVLKGGTIAVDNGFQAAILSNRALEKIYTTSEINKSYIRKNKNGDRHFLAQKLPKFVHQELLKQNSNFVEIREHPFSIKELTDGCYIHAGKIFAIKTKH